MRRIFILCAFFLFLGGVYLVRDRNPFEQIAGDVTQADAQAIYDGFNRIRTESGYTLADLSRDLPDHTRQVIKDAGFDVYEFLSLYIRNRVNEKLVVPKNVQKEFVMEWMSQRCQEDAFYKQWRLYCWSLHLPF